MVHGGTAAILLAAAATLGPSLLLTLATLALVVRILHGTWTVPAWAVVPAFILALATAPLLNVLAIVLVSGATLFAARWLEQRPAKPSSLKWTLEALEADADDLASAEVSPANAEEILAKAKEVKSRLADVKSRLDAQRSRLERLQNALLTVVALLALMLLARSDDVWLPAEAFALSDGSHVVGYGRDDGPWLRVIEDRDRTVRVIEQANVTARTVCERDRGPTIGPDWLGASLIGLLSEGPEHPNCEDFE